MLDITPIRVKKALETAFPGVDLAESRTLDKKIQYTVRFSEFIVEVVVPENPKMNKHTTFRFRRIVKTDKNRKVVVLVSHQRVRYNGQFNELNADIDTARSYINGLVLNMLLGLEPEPKADIFR